MNILESVFDWLLTTTLRASVLAVVILGMQLLLRRWLPPQWRHSLWLPLLIVLALPVLPSVPFGIFPRKAAVTATAAPEAAANTQEANAAPAEQTPVAPAHQTGLTRVNPWAATWLAGSALVLAVGIASYRRNMRRIMKGAVPVDEALRRSIEGAAREVDLRRKPRVIVSTAVDSPAVTGLVRPSLLLPAGFPAGFSQSEEHLILLHELTHLKRFDLPVTWLTCVFQAVHWFNPILWFAFARMRADRESACDAQVLSLAQDDCRSDYGHALLKLQSAAPHPGLNLGFVGIFERSSELKTRIREISSHRAAHPAWRAAGTGIIAVLTLFGATKAQEPEPEQESAPVVPRVTINKPIDPGVAAIEAKLDKIVIPLVKFEDTSLEEAIDFVRLRTVELDTETDRARKGINFVIRKPRTGAKDIPDPGQARLTVNLKDASVRKVLTEIARSSGMRFKVDAFAITFVPAGEKDSPPEPPRPEPPKLRGKAVDASSKIIIPIVDFEDVSLKEAVEFLNLRAKEISGEEPAFSVVLDPKANAAPHVKELRLRNVPLTEAVKYMAESTRCIITANDTEIRITRP